MVHCWLGRTMVEINTSNIKDMSVKHGKTRVFSVNGQTLGDEKEILFCVLSWENVCFQDVAELLIRCVHLFDSLALAAASIDASNP